MRPRFFVLLVACFLLYPTARSAIDVQNDVFKPISTEYDKFDWSLTKKIAASSEDNFLLSPLGLKLALSILTEASTGVTQSELFSLLGMDRNKIRRKFTDVIESLKKPSPEYDLSFGSRIYITDKAIPRQRFVAIAHEFYNTELKAINFDNPRLTAEEINSWVSNITRGNIPTIVDEDDVADIIMALLIVNTLYFKGSWLHQFTPNATKPSQFFVSPKLTKVVPMMNVYDRFYYYESAKLDAKILRMPYLGNHKYAMYLLVPNSLLGLHRVLENVNDLHSELGKLREHYVDVTMPKFKFDYASHLDGILKELGVQRAFENTASFPGIARGQQLEERIKVSKVIQRNGIDVNELGSIAYSVTGISLENKFAFDIGNEVEVVANRPFMFFIQDEATGQLLFTGRVADPSIIDGAYGLS